MQLFRWFNILQDIFRTLIAWHFDSKLGLKLLGKPCFCVSVKLDYTII